MECGFCLRKDTALEDPKVLPCSHAHCLQCLKECLNREGVVKCPKCREVFDVVLESLAAADVPEDNSPSCDTCSRRGVKRQLAETYCTTCSKKFCAKHRESHDDVLDDHRKIPISEYKSQAAKLEIRNCTEHNITLTAGCKACLSVMCADCVFNLGTCSSTGGNHELMKLNELTAGITKEIYQLKSQVLDKEEKLEDLLKKTSENIADYETETRELVERIHHRRDEQIEAIKEKYESLEKKLLELRAECKAVMTKYMDEDVGLKLSDLSQHNLRIQTRVTNSHQADIVTEFRDTKDKIQKLLDDLLPELKLETYSLECRGESREIELQIVTSTDPPTFTAPPTSLKLPVSVSLPDEANSVCHYQGHTYVGQYDGTVSKIDSSYQLMESFLTFSKSIEGCKVYKDRVYTLVDGSPYKVHDSAGQLITYKVTVHDLAGQLITSWDHTDTHVLSTMLTIVSDQIVIPERRNKRLTLYSLTGEILKHIPCPQLAGECETLNICTVDNDSVVLSICDNNQIVMLKISTGEEIWSFSHVTNPRGVVCYEGSCVFVASGYNDEIHILDVRTGAFLSEVTAAGRDGNAYDLHISGETLIVPSFSDKKVLFYRMQ